MKLCPTCGGSGWELHKVHPIEFFPCFTCKAVGTTGDLSPKGTETIIMKNTKEEKVNEN